MITFFKAPHRSAHFFHYSYSFVSQCSARFYIGNFSFNNAKISSADGGHG